MPRTTTAEAEKPSSGFPNPSPWLTIILSLVVGFGASQYNTGRLEQRVANLEEFKADIKEAAKREARDREARYQQAEAERKKAQASEVEAIQKTAEDLKEALKNIKR